MSELKFQGPLLLLYLKTVSNVNGGCKSIYKIPKHVTFRMFHFT